MQLSFFEDETPMYAEGTKTKTCIACGEEKPLDHFSTAFTTTKSGKSYKVGRCKPCQSERISNTTFIKKTAPPIPTNCACCGVSFEDMQKNNIHMDHCEETQTFRGWLCRNCNLGIGQLGDNIEGLQKALNYLQEHDGRLSKEAD